MKKDLLTKEEIGVALSPPPAEPLSIRSVERYIKQAQVQPAVRGSGRGKQAMFRREDVEKMAAAYRAAAEQRKDQSTALTTTKLANVQLVAFVAELAEAVKSIRQTQKSQPQANVGEKMMLSPGEAAAVAGLSENFIRSKMKAGKLKAKIYGRGYKIKRSDLDAFIKKL